MRGGLTLGVLGCRLLSAIIIINNIIIMIICVYIYIYIYTHYIYIYMYMARPLFASSRSAAPPECGRLG